MRACSPQLLLAVIVAFAAAGMTGCATKVAEPSGFLANPTQLKRNKKMRTPDFEYRSEGDLPLAAGTKVYVAPVEVRIEGESKADDAIRSRLAESFTQALRAEIGEAFPLASSRNGSQVSVRAVVTELGPSLPPLNMATAVYPSARLTAELQHAVTGQQSFTGEASTEIEVLRTAGSARIYAMMDCTTGRKAISTSGSSWAPVEKLCERWAKDLVSILQGKE